MEVIEAVEMPVVFPVHPRTRAALERAGLLERARAAARLTAPLGYLDFTALLMSAAACLTDSGGVQKEAYLHRVPCVTLRDTTEWVETIAAGWNRLVDLDPAAVAAALASASRPAEHPPLYGDGAAAGRIAAVSHHRRPIASGRMPTDVAIVGAGYVGLPLAVEFGRAGRSVVCVESDGRRVEAIGRGESYIEDVDSAALAELVSRGHGLRPPASTRRSAAPTRS